MAMANALRSVTDRFLTATTIVWRDATQRSLAVFAGNLVRWHVAIHIAIVYAASHAFPATRRTAHLPVPIASGKSFNLNFLRNQL